MERLRELIIIILIISFCRSFLVPFKKIISFSNDHGESGSVEYTFSSILSVIRFGLWILFLGGLFAYSFKNINRKKLERKAEKEKEEEEKKKDDTTLIINLRSSLNNSDIKEESKENNLKRPLTYRENTEDDWMEINPKMRQNHSFIDAKDENNFEGGESKINIWSMNKRAEETKERDSTQFSNMRMNRNDNSGNSPFSGINSINDKEERKQSGLEWSMKNEDNPISEKKDSSLKEENLISTLDYPLLMIRNILFIIVIYVIKVSSKISLLSLFVIQVLFWIRALTVAKKSMKKNAKSNSNSSPISKDSKDSKIFYKRNFYLIILILEFEQKLTDFTCLFIEFFLLIFVYTLHQSSEYEKWTPCK